MSVKWTKEQQSVIDTRGKNILVSAAAGSGKTAVLVARILAMVTDGTHPIDIDRLLVVTFTNAAAAEMRQRIGDALEERAEAEPENEHLQRQLVLIHNAKITTIHSFCLQVLRSHFHTVGIDPAFRVADEGEVLLLKQDVLGETLEEAYETSEEGGEFRTLLEQFTPGRDDRAVGDAVLALYHFSLGQPWPDEWLKQCADAYGKACPESMGDPAWLAYAAEDTHRVLADVREQICKALRIAKEPDGPYPYAKALQDDLEMVEALCRAEDYEGLAQAFAQSGTYTRLSTKKDPAISEEKKQRVQEIRSQVKEDLAKIRVCYFYDRPEILREEFRESGVIVRELTRLTERFSTKLAEKKAEKNLLDFSDLEHLALQVLVEHRDKETLPTAAAREYAEQFEEILIDEYQDSNLVQEILLNSVSGKGRGKSNRFMVGDVKQSIYRFRLARPELFLEKYHTYRTAGEQSCRIDLHKNFRSRQSVLGSVNYIFRQIMTENPGGIVYDKDAALYAGAEFEEKPDTEEAAEETTELWLMEADGPEKQEAEARMVGERIRRMVGTTLVWDPKWKNAGLQEKSGETSDKTSGGYRPAQYRDIVILLRTVSGWADTFGAVLTDMGIPCFTGSQKGYFSAAEVRVVLAYLEVLDNPVQDIPLASVLRSPIGGLTDEELAQIRSASQQRQFYDCCEEYRADGMDTALREKLERFFEMTERLRRKAAYTPVHLLLWEILDVTGYGEYAAALPGGSQRKANLDMLIEKAIAYESTSYRGLYHFVRYIENLKRYEVDYGEANVGSESDNTVRIMSIHKSKGLEFPIVIVSGMGKQFNESDIRSKLALHPEFGIGCDYVDTELRVRRPNLLKKVIQKATASENMGEELRVLYVAMTRAKEKLILTGTVSDAADKLEKWSACAHTEKVQLSYARLMSASTYLDWVVPAVLRHPDGAKLAACPGTGVQMQEVEVCKDLLSKPDEEGERTEAEELRNAFTAHYACSVQTMQDLVWDHLQSSRDDFKRLQALLENGPEGGTDASVSTYLETVFAAAYPYALEQGIAGKVFVSELKKQSQIPDEPEAEELYPAETVVPLIPGFKEREDIPQGAARGTAYHTVMENLDFHKKEHLERWLEELVDCGKMTRNEAAAVRLWDIRRFLESEVGKRMERAALLGTLHREQPFVLGVPANTIRAEWSEKETVLVQGIIDAWFVEEDGKIVVLDYKTDRMSDMKTLEERYHVQLAFYALALQRLTGREVKEQILYSFCLGREWRI